MSEVNWSVGEFHSEVLLELIKDHGVSRPRMKPITKFPEDLRVEVSRQLREEFPLGTRFEARVKVCQKHRGSKAHGPPYLRVCEIGVVVKSFRDTGLVAKLDPSGADGRKYFYIFE